jgi:hypothetical protein
MRHCCSLRALDCCFADDGRNTFTIITTGGLVPLEVYEISRHVTAAKIVVLAVNVAMRRVPHGARQSKDLALRAAAREGMVVD